MFKIGVVNIDVSHPLAFSEILLKENRARYAAVYNDGFRGQDEVEGFVKKRGLDKICATVEELADYVDIGFVQGCNWDKHLDYAEVFINKGKPVFIDKPIVGSIADCKRLKALVEKGANILGSSSLRYAKELVDFMSIPAEERGEIINIMGTCGIDEFNYGIHVVESIGALEGGAVSCRFAATGEVGGNICDTYAVTFKSGVTATYTTVSGVWLPCYFLVTTTKTVHNINVDVSQVYKALLDRICDYMETGKSDLADVDTLIESIKIMLAGRISKEKGGVDVKLADIPDDDKGYDGAEFEKGYAAKASKIYL